ncbi:factor H binding protein domain-containing protein [Gallibacterium melopsittaci]|uniref:Factor H binding protein domain-containing protein n=1 Tax=Gallibacterium melopsittaci TaxID=516063 RepID=A0ABV6HY81_9PAST
MTKKLHGLMPLFVALGITACSSSGGSENNHTSNTINSSNTTNSSNSIHLATHFDDYYLEDRENVSPTNDNEIDNIEDELDKILVLDGSGYKKANFTTNEASYDVYAVNLNDSAYSIMISHNREKDFARLDTANDSTKGDVLDTLSGKATYIGTALLVDQNHNITTDGTVKLEADFTNKNISGEIKNNVQNITLNNAKISKATNVTDSSDNFISFSGTATTNTGFSGDYSGSFAGKNANEVTGIAVLQKGDEKLGAAFGGTKQ